MKYILYTDGACSGNPGPGGYGYVLIEDHKLVIEGGGYDPDTTNNRMEIQAVISGLNRMDRSAEDIQIYTDSVYVIKGITQWIFGWKKNNWKNAEGEGVSSKDLWMQLDLLVGHFSAKIKWSYVRGHNQDPGNERCDKIAVSFSKRDHVHLYHGSAENYYFDVTRPAKVETLPESNWKSGAKEKKNSWYLSLTNGVVNKHQTWSECEAQVKGRSGVKFKKVSSEQEEQDLLRSWGKL